jgi:Response regulators consisting of a CheY-like receiver domain and a winged-helix DNA-binding domain
MKQPAVVDFTGRRVLLVEDNEMNREIAQDILEDEGLAVETAEDGSAAVKTA